MVKMCVPTMWSVQFVMFFCSAEHLIRIPSAINLIYELHYGFVRDVGMYIIVRPLVSEQTGNNHIVRIARK
jgi:hypothetical protein